MILDLKQPRRSESKVLNYQSNYTCRSFLIRDIQNIRGFGTLKDGDCLHRKRRDLCLAGGRCIRVTSPVLALSLSRNATLSEERVQGQLSAHAHDKPITAHLSSHVTFKLDKPEKEKIYLVAISAFSGDFKTKILRSSFDLTPRKLSQTWTECVGVFQCSPDHSVNYQYRSRINHLYVSILHVYFAWL